MSEPATEYRVWRPEPTNAPPGPAYEPPPLDVRRDRVRAGFDAVFVDALAARLGISPSDLLQRVGVRRPDGARSVGPAAAAVPDEPSAGADVRVIGVAADALHELHLLAERAEAVLGHPDSVPAWFGAAVGALGRTRPLDWLDTTAGRERVTEVLDAIAYGFPG